MGETISGDWAAGEEPRLDAVVPIQGEGAVSDEMSAEVGEDGPDSTQQPPRAEDDWYEDDYVKMSA